VVKAVYFRARAATAYYNQSRWYESQRVGLGSEFELCVDASIQMILRHGGIGTIVSKSVRRVLVKRFPFGLYYRNHKDHIEVIGIRHFRMKPIK
jgi:toxin ParE1/3/4